MEKPIYLYSEDEFKTLFKNCLEEALKPLKSKNHSSIPDPFMTIKEVCAFFKVSPSTIHCWRKEGRLKAYYKGRRVYFKRAEVEESLVQSQNS